MCCNTPADGTSAITIRFGNFPFPFVGAGRIKEGTCENRASILTQKHIKILLKWYHVITKPSSTFQDKTKKMSKYHTKTHSSRQNNAFQKAFPFEGKVGTKCSAFSGKCLRHWLRRALGYPWKCLRHFLRLTVGWGVARVKNRFHSRNFLRRKSLVSSKTKKSVAKSNAVFFAEFLPLWNALWFLCYKVFIFISL